MFQDIASLRCLKSVSIVDLKDSNESGGHLLHLVNYGIFIGLSRLVFAYQRILREILESVRYLQVMSAYPQVAFLLKV